MKNIEIFDNSSETLARFEPGADNLDISGLPGGVVDQAAFLKRLARIAGRSLIKHVQVKFTSNLTNCDFLTLLPEVESLILESKRIESVRGLHGAKRLKRLIVDTGAQNKIDVSDVKGSTVEFIQLRGARLEDVKIIAESQIVGLELTGGKLDDIAPLAGSNITGLVLTGIPVRQIGEINSVGVNRLSLALCRDFCGFSADNETVKWLTIEACNRFEISTLGCLKVLRTLRLLVCRGQFDLGDLAVATSLEEIVLTKCNVSIGARSLESLRNLRRLWISPLQSPIARKISEMNPGVLVSNGKVVFCGGLERDLREYYR